MPQSRNKKAMAETVLISKGSTRSRLTDASFAIQKRALKVNETEHKRLELMLKVMDKHGRAQENKRQRTIGRINKNLKQLDAYRHVLNDEYKVDNFDTLTFGYKAKEAKKDPARFQRFVYETRIYHAGYSIRNLRRQVELRLQEADPQQRRLQAKQDMLAEARKANERLNYSIDRKSSLTQIFENHRTKHAHVPKLPPIKQSREEDRGGERQAAIVSPKDVHITASVTSSIEHT